MSNVIISLKLIVYAISLCVSSMPLALSIASLNYHKKPWSGWYIVFQSALIGSIFLGFLDLLAESLFPAKASVVFRYIFEIMQLCTMGFVAVLLPFFMYFVLAKPWKARQRLFFYPIAIIYFGLGLFGKLSTIYPITNLSSTGIFIFLYCYCLVVLIINLRNVQDKQTRAICLTVFITSLCLIPASLIAFIFPHVADFAYPIYLLAFSIIMIVYFGIVFKTDKIMRENKPKMTLKSLSKFKISEREFSVIKLIGEGFTNKEIAFELGISVNTVNNHVSNIFEKMEVKSRIDLLNLVKEGPMN